MELLGIEGWCLVATHLNDSDFRSLGGNLTYSLALLSIGLEWTWTGFRLFVRVYLFREGLCSLASLVAFFGRKCEGSHSDARHTWAIQDICKDMPLHSDSTYLRQNMIKCDEASDSYYRHSRAVKS